MWYREDLRKKYKVPEIKKLSDFEMYFDAIKKHEPKMTPLGLGKSDLWGPEYFYAIEKASFSDTGISNTQCFYNLEGKNPKIRISAFDKFYQDWTVIAKRWADKGFWSKNVLFNSSTSSADFDIGKSAAASGNSYIFNAAYQKAKTDHPSWQIGFYRVTDSNGKVAKPPLENGVAVNANSKNPERTLMAIETILYDPEIQTLSIYGEKGVDYEVNSKGYYVMPPKGKTLPECYTIDTLFGIGIHNDNMNHDDPSRNSPIYNKLSNEENFKKVSVLQVLQQFSIDRSKIKNQLAAASAAMSTYQNMLIVGEVDNPSKTLAEYRKALQNVGIEKIRTEIQRQVNEYIAK
jgi:putative aldouronate transport system substrate-binding protein